MLKLSSPFGHRPPDLAQFWNVLYFSIGTRQESQIQPDTHAHAPPYTLSRGEVGPSRANVTSCLKLSKKKNQKKNRRKLFEIIIRVNVWF